jgi:hypothetical protein
MFATKRAAMPAARAVDAEALAAEYEALRGQESAIKKRKDAIAAILKDEAERRGSMGDTGSYSLDTGSFIVCKQARKSVSFRQQEAVAWLKGHGHGGAVVVTESVDERGVERLVAAGEIGMGDLEAITAVKTIYAIDIKKKEEIPSAETATLSLAARRKPR